MLAFDLGRFCQCVGRDTPDVGHRPRDWWSCLMHGGSYHVLDGGAPCGPVMALGPSCSILVHDLSSAKMREAVRILGPS